MKKHLLIGLLLLTSACLSPSGDQAATSTPEPALSLTATVPASPTPVPASSTPEPTPTLELTPTPLPRFFTQEFDMSLAGWVILQAGNEALPNASLENSTLRLQMDSPYTWLYALYSSEDYTDVYIETEYSTARSVPPLSVWSAATAKRTAGSNTTSPPTAPITSSTANGWTPASPTTSPSSTAHPGMSNKAGTSSRSP